MSILYPITFTAVIATLWLATAIQGHRVLRAFVNKYPTEAQREIPHAFSRIRHPEKLLFFFRSRSLLMLKSDLNLWKLRQQFKLLLVLSIAVPLLCFLVLAGFAIHAYFQSALSIHNRPYVEVALANQTSTNCFLKVQLKNTSKYKVQVDAGKLPWNSMGTVMVNTDQNNAIINRNQNAVFMIRDFMGITELESGQEIQRTIGLDHLFYDTAISASTSNNLVLFWTYKLTILDGSEWPRVGGWVLLPKTVRSKM